MEDKIKQQIIAINNEVGAIVKHECANITTRIQVMLHELLKAHEIELGIAKLLEEEKAKQETTPDETQA